MMAAPLIALEMDVAPAAVPPEPAR
jgi:hypothetical protein